MQDECMTLTFFMAVLLFLLSIMIMPPEDEFRSEGLQANAGEVTQPFVTEAYTCVAPYETKDCKNKPLKVAKGDKLDVVIKDKGGEPTAFSQLTRITLCEQYNACFW